MYYRNELDGLRAIAVLSVVLYHAGFTIFPGGFIGVDIFFVLSGFLITSIIHRQILSSTFTFTDFYWRRFRRILPALFFMILVVGIACHIFLDPIAYKDFAKSAWATALFSSNILFWTEAGYFDKAAELKPLLHTWSLGVEEQYYIFFPVLMIFIRKYFSDKFVMMLALVGGASLLLSIYGAYFKPIATFYLLPTRLWELLIGSLLAVSNIPTLRNRLSINIVSWLGLIMMVSPILFYTSDTIFPGLAAIPPCLGTVIIIWSLKDQQKTSLKNILSFGPMAFIGKVSYSFYLWHWPALILCEYYTIDKLTLTDRFLVVCGAFLISCFSWRVIEKPFRENFVLFPKVRMLKISFISIALVTSLGAAIWKADGLSSRFDADLKRTIAAADDRSEYFGSICGDLQRGDTGVKFCELGLGAQPESFVLWGDSHAGAIAPLFNAVAEELNIKGILAFWSGCPPLLGVQRDMPRYDFDCREDRQLIKNYVVDHPEIKTVIITARWALYVENNSYGKDTQHSDLMKYKEKNVRDPEAMVRNSLEDTIVWLQKQGKNVVIIFDVPENIYDIPHVLTKISIMKFDVDIRTTLAAYKKRQAKFFKIATDMSQKYAVTLLYPHKYMCGKTLCEITKNDVPLYFDSNHLSVFGAMQLKELAREALTPPS